ncbi:DUF11 domain-containing protein [Nakamurella silvestris]|nr:DUF11 domain-containing protein [Nakamurella silvestris]
MSRFVRGRDRSRSRWWVIPAVLFLLAGMFTVVPAVAPVASAAAPTPPTALATVPTPGANEAVISVLVGGDRLANGTVKGLPGVTLRLYGAGTASTAPSAVTATQGTPGAAYSYSWATCVSDADGDCNFVIPIRTGAVSATGAPQDTRFWVQQTGTPSGWYANPTMRLGGFGPTPEFSWGYRFRTDVQLRAGTTYRSTTAAPIAIQTSPDTGFMRNREDSNAEGGQGENVGRTTGVWSQSRTNPTFASECGLKIALVTDTSGSLGLSGMSQVKSAMDTFVDAFRGTPTSMSLFSFSTVSPGNGASNHPVLLPVTTADQATTFKAQYASWASGGGTSWDRGLAAAANSGNAYDLVVLLTDGNPTTFGATPGAGSSAFNSFQDVDAGIFSANQLKAAGTRVVAIGVGTAVNSAASAFNLRAISGQTEDSDYFRAEDFASAAAILSDLAKANCQGSIQVQKMIVPAGGTIADATPAPAGWEFNSSTSAAGVDISPSSQATVAGADGKVTFGLSFTSPVSSGAVQILENQQTGYELLPVGTGAAARNASCVNPSTGTPVAVPVTNAGSAATPGFTVTGLSGAQIQCTIYNRVVPPVTVPGFTLTKTSDPVSGSTVTGGDTITYTVTGTNTGETVLNPVTITDDLSKVLNHATVTGTPTSSTGGAPTVSGTTLTWTGSLPVGGTVVLTYTVTVDADVPAGTIVHNHAAGTAQPPTTPENPVPPITPPPVETTHLVPGFTLTKTSAPVSGSTVQGGDTITYTVTGTNTGATALDPVTITDNLSAVLNHATLTGTPTASVGSTPVLTGTTLKWTGSLPVGGTVVLTYTVTVDPDVPAGTIVHNHAAGTAQPPTTPENPVPPITPPPVETTHLVPGFTLAKTASPASGSTVLGGGTVTYTVTGTNTGATVLDPVTITDDLSKVLDNATLTGAPTASTGSAPVLTGTTLTWTGSLPVGGKVVLTYKVTVNAAVPAGTVINNHVEGSAQPPTTPENPQPPITPPPVETHHSTPGFILTKTSDPVSGSTVQGGDTITYTVTGTNTGDGVLNPVVITDDLSKVLNHATVTGAPTASAGAAPTVSGTTLTWTGSLAAGAKVVLTYTVTLDADVAAGTIVNNHASATAQPPTTPENPVPPITPPPVETTHLVPGFTLAKTSSPAPGSTVTAGSLITYTVTGTNTGATLLDPVTLTDDLSKVLNNATLVGAPTASVGSAPVLTGTTLKWTGTLPVGGAVVLTYTVALNADVTAGTIVNNHATGTAQPPTTPENPQPPITPPPVTTEHLVPGFTLTKTADPVTGSVVEGGDAITYTVTGTNTGATVLDPVVITDDLSKVLNNATLTGVPTASVGAAPVLTGTTMSWTGSLPVGGKVVLTYTVTLKADVAAGTVVNNHASATAQPPTTPENPVPPITPPPVETTHSTPGFSLTKTSDPVSGSTVRGGDTITYTVTGTNTGATVLDPVTLTDDLSEVLDHATLTGAPTSSTGAVPTVSGTTLTWTGSLQAGAKVVLTYTVTLDGDIPAGTVVNNTVKGSAQPPTTPENPEPPIVPPPVTTEHPVPGFTLTKVSDPASGSTVTGGDLITYTVTGTNTGATVLDPVVITDDLSKVLNHATLTGSPSATSGSAPVLTGTDLTWTGTLPVGGTVVLTYTVVLDTDVAAGTVVNNHASGTAQPPTTPENPQPPITPPPVETSHPVPGFTLTKTADPVTGSVVEGGDTITYTVTGTNTGATVLDPVTLTDDLSKVLNNATLAGAPTSSVGAAPTVSGTTLTWTGILPVGGKVVLTYTVTIASDVTAGTVVNNTVEGSAQPPTTPEHPVPPITPPPVVTQHSTPGFSLTKTSDPVSGSTVVGGDTITYTVTGTNTGATVLDPVVVTDDLSKVLDHATLTGAPTASTGAAPVVSGTTLTWTGSLPVGAKVVLTYTVTLDRDIPAGTIVNNTVAGSAQPPTTPENPEPPIVPPPVTTEHLVPGFTLAKTADPVSGSTVVGGDTITYTVTGTNTGATVLDPVIITDDLSKVLNHATLAGTPSASSGAAPVVTGTTLTWTGTLPVGGTVVLTYSVVLDTDVAAGTIVNNHASGTSQPPTTPEHPVPPIVPPPVTTEHPVPGFTLTKTANPPTGSTVVAGGEITYTVTGTNTGATVLDPVTLTDDLSKVLTNATLTGAPAASVGAAPVISGTTLSWTGSLPVGGKVVLTYTVTVNDGVPAGTVVDNHVSGTAQPPTTPEHPVPPITPPPVETTHSTPGFSLTKTSDPLSGSTVRGGDTITYTVTGTNTGATVLDPVIITDDLAEVLDHATLTGTPAASAGPAPVVTGTTLTWTGSLPVGAKVVLTYTVTLDSDIPAGTIVNNHASGTAQPPTTPENPVPPITPPPVETHHPVPGFTLAKTADPTNGSAVTGGDTITYTVTGTNTGATVLDPVSITDDLSKVLNNATLTGTPTASAGGAPVLTGTTLRWTGSLPVGGTVVLTYTVTLAGDIAAGTIVDNQAEGSAQPPTTPEHPEPPIIPPPVVTEHPVPGFALTKKADPVSGSTVRGGDTITYTVTGTNTGATVLDPVTVTDDLAKVLNHATLTGTPKASTGTAPVVSGTTLTWTGSLPVGAKVVLTYTVVVDKDVSAGTVIDNHASGTAQPPTTPEHPVPPITPPPVETTHSTPGFTLTKTADPASGSIVRGGDTITYTVTGTNTGTGTLDPVVITDDMSKVLDHGTLVGRPTASTGGEPVRRGTTLTWTGSLAEGQAVTLKYTVKLDLDIPGITVRNTVSGTATPPTGPPIVPPPVTTEHPVPGFTVVKSADPASGTAVEAGDTINYTITATNTGATVLDPVNITDDLSGVLAHTWLVGQPKASQGRAALSGARLTWTGSLAVGAELTITYQVRVKADVTGGSVVRNTVTSSAVPVVPHPPTKPEPPIVPPPSVTEHPVPGFELTKTSNVPAGAVVAAGDTITYTVTGKNTGATVLDPVVITDDMSKVLDNAALVGTPTASLGAAPSLTGTTLTWSGTLEVGEAVRVTYQVVVNSGVAPGVRIDNSVQATYRPPGQPPHRTPKITVVHVTEGNPPPTVTPPLPNTGVDVPGLATTAGLLLLLGGFLHLVGRRRRTAG